MSHDLAIRLREVSKCYPVFSRPEHRLLQMLSFGQRKYYTEFWALKKVSFDVHKGEVVGIVGRNGSGKSTLLQIIAGNLSYAGAELHVDGKVSALLELGAGFNAEFTGKENVMVSGAILGWTAKETLNRYDGIVDFADIGSFMDQPVKTYSSGMYARLAFSVAISAEPDILIVDEALAVGDEAFQRKCFARIEKIKQDDGTILFVSHAPSAIIDLCDRAVLMHEGERLYTGEPKETVGLYQKLVYADEKHVDDIRLEILREDKPQSRSQSLKLETDASPAENRREDTNVAEVSSNKCDPLPYFEPGLVSQSEVVYPPAGARIEDVQITGPGGERVNFLVSGQCYSLQYNVEFSDSYMNVRCYNTLKTVTGSELGGGVFPYMSRPGIEAKKNEVLQVVFDFRCRLNTGTYFINCGVGAEQGRVLHRILDATVFKVVDKANPGGFGTVDFDYSGRIGVG
ncbi:MAG: ABC transporter ATP-binding protein [Rhodothermia bacterium]|nr:MAG: ABC transporter ATP-binding protein [Rhodothermia bacterium]